MLRVSNSILALIAHCLDNLAPSVLQPLLRYVSIDD